MVVTGFEVFGAVSGALGTLNLVRQLVDSISTFVKDWKDSGPKMLEIHDTFDTFIVRLETWRVRSWSIDAQFSDEVGKAYWGENGWRSIALQLGYIDKTVQDFLIVFEKAVDPVVIAHLRPKHESAFAKVEGTVPGNWQDRTCLSTRRGDSVRRLRELGRDLSANISPMKKAKIVTDRAAALLDRLTSLNARFLLLEHDANAFFEAQHPTVTRYAPPEHSGYESCHRSSLPSLLDFYQQWPYVRASASWEGTIKIGDEPSGDRSPVSVNEVYRKP
jgi:hypothetical protein